MSCNPDDDYDVDDHDDHIDVVVVDDDNDDNDDADDDGVYASDDVWCLR